MCAYGCVQVHLGHCVVVYCLEEDWSLCVASDEDHSLATHGVWAVRICINMSTEQIVFNSDCKYSK